MLIIIPRAKAQEQGHFPCRHLLEYQRGHNCSKTKNTCSDGFNLQKELIHAIRHKRRLKRQQKRRGKASIHVGIRRTGPVQRRVQRAEGAEGADPVAQCLLLPLLL